MTKPDTTSKKHNGFNMMGITGFYCPKCKKELALSGGLWYCLNRECITDTVKIEILTTKEID